MLRALVYAARVPPVVVPSAVSRGAAALRALGPVAGLAAVWGLFAVLVGGPFTAWDNQRLMLLQTAVVGTAGVGATFILISRGLDLSVGSTIALGTMVIALVSRAGGAPALAAAAGVGAGLIVGAAIGSMVVGRLSRAAGLAVAIGVGWWATKHMGPWPALGTGIGAGSLVLLAGEFLLPKVELSPFIVTLGLWGALRGVAKGLGENQPVYPKEAGWLLDIMTPAQGGVGSVLPPGVWVMLAVALVFAAMIRWTVLGRRAVAIGSNETAARYAGVPISRVKLWVYTLGVGAAGVASVLQFSFLNIGDPTTAGGYELKVIAAAVIGGASLSGGEGSIFGTLVGAFIMTVVDNGCTKLGLDNWVQEVVTGAIIVGAVVLDRLRARRSDPTCST